MQKVGLHQISMLFKPDTLLRWHRDLVKKKWTFDTTAKHRGRPSVSPEIEQLVVQLAKENDWGAGKIEGELQKLGYRICKQTVLNILKRQGISPLPQRDRTSNWRSFINHYHKSFLACDFLTVETLWLQTLYVFFIIDVSTWRVYIGGVTTHATGQWVTQQARQLNWQFEDDELHATHLIRDNDTRYVSKFDTVSQSRSFFLTYYQSEHLKLMPLLNAGFDLSERNVLTRSLFSTRLTSSMCFTTMSHTIMKPDRIKD